MNIAKILRTAFFYRTPPVASVDLLFLIKNNVEWSVLKRLANVVRVRYLQTISRNNSSTPLLINLQKTKNYLI